MPALHAWQSAKLQHPIDPFSSQSPPAQASGDARPGYTPDPIDPGSRRSARQVNDVLQMLNDSVEGFSSAATKLQDLTFADACIAYSQERARLAEDLRPLVIAGGIEPTVATEIRGTLARAWMAVCNALGGGDRAIIENIECAEDHAVEVYRMAIVSEDLTQAARSKLLEQYPLIKSAHDQFSAWKRRFITP